LEVLEEVLPEELTLEVQPPFGVKGIKLAQIHSCSSAKEPSLSVGYNEFLNVDSAAPNPEHSEESKFTAIVYLDELSVDSS